MIWNGLREPLINVDGLFYAIGVEQRFRMISGKKS